MGSFDYEYAMSKTDSKGKNEAEKLKENIAFCEYYAKWATSDANRSPYVLNRPCFFYTKNREDMTYVHSTLYSTDSSVEYVFLVNEKSFWRRFSIRRASDGMIIEPGENSFISVAEMVTDIIDHKNDYKISLNIYGFEKHDLENCQTDYVNADMRRFIYDSAPVSFTAFKTYNKRLWLYLFDNPKLVFPDRTDLGQPGQAGFTGYYSVDEKETLDPSTGAVKTRDRTRYKAFV